jgi:Isocitrate/isopropylmalate dehydrogenase
MLLDFSFGLKKESKLIFKAVEKVLMKGFGTKDIGVKNILGTNELGDVLAGEI